MMTEELTPDFEVFSQMLDDEGVEPGRQLTDDQQLLVDLREVLREKKAPPLPNDFASETSRVVRERYAKLSTVNILMDKSRALLLDTVFRPRAMAKGLGMAALGLGLAAASFKALAAYGSILLVFSVCWLALQRKAPDLELPRRSTTLSHRLSSAVFYLMPALAVGLTALLAAAVIGMLGSFSVSFRGSSDATVLLCFQVLVSLGTGILLAKACIPVWRAFRARATTHSRSVAVFQAVHALWLGLLLWIAWNSYGMAGKERADAEQYGLLGALLMVLAVAFATRFAYRYSLSAQVQPDLARAGRTLVSSLVLGFCPIALVVFGFYQMHLTREMLPSYEFVLADVQAWEKAQKEIPDAENGWIELRPFFIRPEQEKPENQVVTERLKGLSEFYDASEKSYLTMTAEEQKDFLARKADFLAELPRIESAVEKPYFSSVSTEGFSFESLAPNYIAYRAITQGLALLTQEALANGEPDRALDYVDLNLKWATVDKSGSLITLMVKIAQLSIILENLEEPVVSGQFDEAQLARLSALLQGALPEPSEFGETMKRETVLADKAFRDFVIGNEASARTLGDVGLPPVLAWFPASYWESERKAYWNFHLSQMSDWMSLTNPRFDQTQDQNPLNVATNFLSPATGRGMTHFAYTISKFRSLISMCELERYKLEHGEYPENGTTSLVEDPMSPRPVGKKELFEYHRTADGYTMTSKSPWYEEIDLAARQVYGHDGKFGRDEK